MDVKSMSWSVSDKPVDSLAQDCSNPVALALRIWYTHSLYMHKLAWNRNLSYPTSVWIQVVHFLYWVGDEEIIRNVYTWQTELNQWLVD